VPPARKTPKKLIFFGDIGPDKNRFAAISFDQLCGFMAAFRIDVRHHYPCAFIGKGKRSRTTNTAGAAGHQYHFFYNRRSAMPCFRFIVLRFMKIATSGHSCSTDR
jgi:hypothetical protein